MTLEERMAAKMAARKKEIKEENIATVPSLIKKENLEELSYFDEIAVDPEIRDELKQSTVRILNITSNASLELGKIFTELEKKLARKGAADGIYIKFLTFNGYNRMTALRHRYRYELFEEVKNEETKKLIAILPVRLIEKLYSNKESIKEFLEKGITRKEIENLLEETKQIEEKKNIEKSYFEIGELGGLKLEIENKYENLDEKRKEKLNKLLLEIKTLLEN